MSERLWQDYLSDIIHTVGLILEFTENQSYADFERDQKSQFAVIRCFEILGEAAKRIPNEVKNAHPEIPWKVMAGMRDRLIHGYDQVDIPLLWRTIQFDIPALQTNLKEIRP